MISKAMRAPALKIVTDETPGRTDATIVEVGSMAEATRARALLASEAIALEAVHGKNAYSDYLLRHRRRPPTGEAATIGKMLGGRVEAEDGSLQPPLSSGDQAAVAGIKQRRQQASRRYDQIVRLRSAIALLAQNKDDPAELIACGSVLFNCPEIANQLDDALSWLTRFAEEWQGREKTSCAGDAEPSVCAQS